MFDTAFEEDWTNLVNELGEFAGQTVRLGFLRVGPNTSGFGNAALAVRLGFLRVGPNTSGFGLRLQ
jgi:hypothetical protein